MARTWSMALAGLVVLGACGAGEEGVLPMADEAAANVEAAAPAPPAPTSTASGAPPSTPVPTSFASSIGTVTADELGVSWRPSCPTAVAELRWVEVSHWNDEGQSVTGAIVVHAEHADDVVAAFQRLFDARFPIHSMRPITEFDGDDNASMTANNTSAFNCREIAGRPGVWSQHAYGGAIDINPLVNPWVRGSRVDPAEAAPYVDRDAFVPGMILAGDIVTQAFAEIGWSWGGDWNSTLDYQHFSHNGR